ncbi:MAG: inorganic diphosphatase [Bordetella sp.]|nr:MAG: inorganic diphosphatase [Bordetella sp.]
MNLDRVTPGKNVPNEFNVIIEISMNSDPIKYEIDEKSGAIFVDRFMLTALRYPCNYGYIPKTLSEDNDPIDVLVYSPFPIQMGSVITCRAIGMLDMEDESGKDIKILAIPVTRLYPAYSYIKTYIDLPIEEIKRIEHFFKHYKDIEIKKWVKILGWKDVNSANEKILTGIEKFFD